MRASRLLIPVALLIVGGCSRQPDLMPLAVGRSTTYEISYGMEKHVEPVVVERTVPVGGITGFQLSSAHGQSRMGWKGGVLFVSEAANAFFDPPVPLLVTDQKPRDWAGKVTAAGTVSDATAHLDVKADKLDLGTKTVDTMLSTLTITLPRGSISLESWFQPGVGLIRQEQRTGDNLVVRMEMLGGPKE